MTTPTTSNRAVKGNKLPVFRGENFTGKHIGSWLVLGDIVCVRSSLKNYKTHWLCQCSCGSEPQWVIKENLMQGRTTGCVSCYGVRNSGDNNGNWKGFGEISGGVFNRVRNNAAIRDLAVEVTHEDLHHLWLKQDRRCALTGVTLALLDTASLDRINSDLPYTKDNIQWVHKTINKMKNDLPEELFVEMCAHVAAHRAARFN